MIELAPCHECGGAGMNLLGEIECVVVTCLTCDGSGKVRRLDPAKPQPTTARALAEHAKSLDPDTRGAFERLAERGAGESDGAQEGKG